jgi:hypothetical protein
VKPRQVSGKSATAPGLLSAGAGPVSSREAGTTPGFVLNRKRQT